LSRGLITRKNAATAAPAPSTNSNANNPKISGSFDFFFGDATATGGKVLWDCGNGGAGFATGGGGSATVSLGIARD
jgi:hypothetical protein